MKEKSKDAPKWGTIQWIETYRWSEMDRKRRARAEAVVAKAFPDRFDTLKRLPTVCEVCKGLQAVMEDAGIKLPKKLQAMKDKAFGTAVGIEAAVRDEAFARMLTDAWGL